jgi:hypothetical protein
MRLLSYVARKCRIIVDDKLAEVRKMAAVKNSEIKSDLPTGNK